MINCYKYCNYCEINLTQRIMMFTFEENFYEYDVFDEGSHKGSSYDFTENIKRFYVVKGKNNTVIFDTAHLFDKSISLKATCSSKTISTFKHSSFSPLFIASTL